MKVARTYLRRLVVLVIGTLIVLLGIVLLVLPGPGLLTIAAGLALLATEFRVAAVLLRRLRTAAGRAWRGARRRASVRTTQAGMTS